MTYQELMMQSLSDLLENEEDLKFPIYGTLQQKKQALVWLLGPNR